MSTPCDFQPVFDRRPGELEATRGLEHAVPVVVGRRIESGWRIALMREGAVLSLLTFAEARALAFEMADMAQLLEFGSDPDEPRASAVPHLELPASSGSRVAIAAQSHEGVLDRAMLISQEADCRRGPSGHRGDGRPDDPEPCPC